MWGDAMKAIDDTLDYVDFVYPSTVPGRRCDHVCPAPESPIVAVAAAVAATTAAATAVTRRRQRRRQRQRQRHGNGNGGGGTAAAGRAQPSWRRTSAATAAPSALPFTWGVTTPITLPMPFMPSAAAPVCSMAAVTISAISLGSSCWGR